MAGLINRIWGIFGLDDPPEPQYQDSEAQLAPAAVQAVGGGKVVPINARSVTPPTANVAATRLTEERSAEAVQPQTRGQSRVAVIVPQKADDFSALVKHLREGRMVLVNFESFPEGEVRYWLNFIYGATIALEGDVQKIGNSIFLIVPPGVDVTSNQKEIYLARDNQERGRESRLSPREGY